MKAVKKLLYSVLAADAPLMAKLVAAPFMGRLPETGVVSKTKAALVINGDAIRDRPDRETQSYTIDIYAHSHDHVEDTYEDVLRVLGLTDARKQWKMLAVTSPAVKAGIRFESSGDIPDVTSELFHKVTRFRVRVVRAVP